MSSGKGTASAKEVSRTESVPIVFELNVLQVLNLPDSIKNDEKVRIDWRRGAGYKATKSGHVHDGIATISDVINLRAKMDYDYISKQFLSKVTQVQLKHVETGKIVAESDLDLADFVKVNLN